MNALQLACKSSPTYKNFDTIEIGQYEVVKFRFAETKYGKKIQVETAEFFCYLPDRFIKFVCKDEDIAELNRIPHTMHYKGKDKLRKNRVDLEFKPTNESQWLFDDLLTFPLAQKNPESKE